MSHEVESMFSVRERPWHGLGTILDDYPGREEAMQYAGHNWNIIEGMVSTTYGEDELELIVPDWKALIRDDTLTCIGVVKKSYTVVPNSTLWDMVDALVEADGAVKYETAGVLKGGAVLWVLARLDEPLIVKGDTSPTYPYTLVHTSHDYSKNTECACVATRVVCWNTLNMAIKEYTKSGLRYKFRHTKNVMERIEQAKAALSTVRNQFAVYSELVEELCKQSVTKEGVADFINTLIPDPPADVATQRGLDSIYKARISVQNIWEGMTIPEAHKYTAYGLFCTGLEYLDHYRKARDVESYFRRTVYETATAKAKIADLAMSVS